MSGQAAIKVLGFSGSLRAGSFNTAALRVAQALAPAAVTVDIFDLAPIPLYNEDVRANGFPPSVEAFRAAIKASDALLIASPEYNYSIPGVLKNAIDWASRPPDQPFDGKPVALMGASMGALGTARAQYHLRQVFVYLNGHVLNRPEVMIGAAHTRFTDTGELTDENSRALIVMLLGNLRDAALRLAR